MRFATVFCGGSILRRAKKLTKKMTGSDGQSFACICYNSEEFIDWLNKKVLQAEEDRAALVEKNIDSRSYRSVPSIFF